MPAGDNEATILYAPPETTNPLDACDITDLIPLLSKKSFYTPFEAAVTPHKRASKSSNIFYCPVCPSSAIAITESPFTITCPACSWDAADHGIETVSDLLVADTRPHHELFQRIRKLADGLRTRDPLHPPHFSEAPLVEEPSEIPVERRFDARITRREQEPARRRVKEKLVVSVAGVNVGVVEGGEWKLKHVAADVLPVIEARVTDGVTLLVRNEHDYPVRVVVDSEGESLEKGGVQEFGCSGRKIAGWWVVDACVVHEEGVYEGSWGVRLFIK